MDKIEITAADQDERFGKRYEPKWSVRRIVDGVRGEPQEFTRAIDALDWVTKWMQRNEAPIAVTLGKGANKLTIVHREGSDEDAGD